MRKYFYIYNLKKSYEKKLFEILKIDCDAGELKCNPNNPSFTKICKPGYFLRSGKCESKFLKTIIYLK
jgi:hypothetical protein